MKIKIMKDILSTNQCIAEENRVKFIEDNIFVINIMASPGSGKTSIIMELVKALRDKFSFKIIEGDISSTIDSEKFENIGIPVLQINTGGGCHLDANMIKLSSENLVLNKDDILIIENVGNLICPSAFDLGETIKVVVASVPEGDDKPYKYTSMYESADVIILNKIDLVPYINFDKDNFIKGVKILNKNAPIFKISCRTGEGIEELVKWFSDKRISKKTD